MSTAIVLILMICSATDITGKIDHQRLLLAFGGHNKCSDNSNNSSSGAIMI